MQSSRTGELNLVSLFLFIILKRSVNYAFFETNDSMLLMVSECVELYPSPAAQTVFMDFDLILIKKYFFPKTKTSIQSKSITYYKDHILNIFFRHKPKCR